MLEASANLDEDSKCKYEYQRCNFAICVFAVVDILLENIKDKYLKLENTKILIHMYKKICATLGLVWPR